MPTCDEKSFEPSGRLTQALLFGSGTLDDIVELLDRAARYHVDDPQVGRQRGVGCSGEA